jgi:DNA-binding response OmpR family regulator
MTLKTLPILVAIDPDAAWLAFLGSLFSPHYTVVPCQTVQAGYETIQRLRPRVVTIETGRFPDGYLGMSLLPLLGEMATTCKIAVACISAPLPEARLSIRDKIEACQYGADHYFVKGLAPESIRCGVILVDRVVSTLGHSSVVSRFDVA